MKNKTEAILNGLFFHRKKYIKELHKELEEFCKQGLNVFASIFVSIYEGNTNDIITSIKMCYSSIYPKAKKMRILLTKKYYESSQLKKRYAEACIKFIDDLLQSLSLSPAINPSSLNDNTILDVLLNQDAFTLYDENVTLLGKLRLLNDHYTKIIEKNWEDVCEAEKDLSERIWNILGKVWYKIWYKIRKIRKK